MYFNDDRKIVNCGNKVIKKKKVTCNTINVNYQSSDTKKEVPL